MLTHIDDRYHKHGGFQWYSGPLHEKQVQLAVDSQAPGVRGPIHRAGLFWIWNLFITIGMLVAVLFSEMPALALAVLPVLYAVAAALTPKALKARALYNAIEPELHRVQFLDPWVDKNLWGLLHTKLWQHYCEEYAVSRASADGYYWQMVTRHRDKVNGFLRHPDAVKLAGIVFSDNPAMTATEKQRCLDDLNRFAESVVDEAWMIEVEYRRHQRSAITADATTYTQGIEFELAERPILSETIG